MKLDCEQVRPLLESFEDNQLDGATSLAVQLHLDECASCRQRLTWNEELTASLERIAAETPAADLLLRRRALDISLVGAASPPRPAPAWRDAAPTWLRAAAAAAAVLVALLVAGGAGFFWQRGQRQRAEAVIMPFVANHLASLTKPQPVDLATSDPREAESWLQARLAFAVKLPE